MMKYDADLLDAYSRIGCYYSVVAAETLVMRLLSGIVGLTSTLTLMILQLLM
jgi:hypothetical protein